MGPEADDATPPSRREVRRALREARGPGGTANVTRREYAGCGLWAAGFLVLVVVSFGVGVALRPDPAPQPGSGSVTLAQNGSGEDAYRLLGSIDEVGEPCVTLVRADGGDTVTGQCGFSISAEPPGEGQEGDRYLVTSTELPGGDTVVFGPVPRQASTVRLHLADGNRPTVPVRRSENAGFSWFVLQTPETVDGPAEMLDGNGQPIRPG